MFINKQILVFTVLLFSLMIHSQTCDLVLKGVVRDDDNSEHLGFAVVKLLSPEKIIQTNERGEFVFENLCSDNYNILIQHVGCKDTIFSINLLKSKKIIFNLPHSYNQLKDIEVIVEKKADEILPQAMETINLKGLDKSKGLPLGEVLKGLNGITTINNGATISKPMINGMQGYRIMTLNNGIRQEGQNWGNEHAPEIDPFIAQKITVIRGTSTVRYGSDAIGGVILIEPNSLPDSASLTGEFNSVGATNGKSGIVSGQLQGYFDKLKGFSWRVQGTVKQGGSMKTPTYYLKNTGVEEKNFSYALAYHGKKFNTEIFYSQFNSVIGIFSSAHIGNLTDLQAAFNRSKPADSLATFSYEIDRPKQVSEHELVKFNFHFHTGLRSRLYANYAYQYNKRQEYDKHKPRNNQLAQLNLPDFDFRLTTHYGEVLWEHDYINRFSGKFGVQGMYQENAYTGRYLLPGFFSGTWGIFALEKYILPKIEFEIGARYDEKYITPYVLELNEFVRYHNSFNGFSFNTGFIYKPFNGLKTSFYAANGWRSPSVNELYTNGLHHGTASIERGDKNLKSEQSFNVISNTQFTYKKIETEFTMYNYYFKNFIYYFPGERPELTIRGAFPVFYYKQNNANIFGMDGSVKYSFPFNMYTKLRGMVVRGYNLDDKQPLIYMPADRIEGTIGYNFKDKKYFNDSYIEFVSQAVNKQTRVPENSDFAPTPESYFLVGGNLSTTVNLKRQPLVFTISITNGLNTIYRDYLDRFRYYNDAIGTNITFRLRMPFTLYNKNKQKHTNK